MKKSILTITTICLLVFGVGAAAHANGDQSGFHLSDPGTLPGQTSYAFERIFENIGTALTFRKDSKRQRRLRLAEERLAEVTSLAHNGNAKLASTTLQRYERQLNRVQSPNGTSTAVSTIPMDIASSTVKHQAVLARVYEKAPKAAQAPILHALSVSARHRQHALSSLNPQQKRKAKEAFKKVSKTAADRLQTLRDKGVPVPEYAGPEKKKEGTPPPEHNPDPPTDNRPENPAPSGDTTPDDNGKKPVQSDLPQLSEMQQAPNKDACVLVPRNICDCSAGGGKIAINEKYKERWQAKLDHKRRAGIPACQQVYRCGTYTITYENGKCGATFQSDIQQRNAVPPTEDTQNEDSSRKRDDTDGSGQQDSYGGY